MVSTICPILDYFIRDFPQSLYELVHMAIGEPPAGPPRNLATLVSRFGETLVA